MLQENYWQGKWCIEVAPEPAVLVLFGAGGDLAQRKLFPSLYQLFRRKLLHEDSVIIGCARAMLDTAAFREKIRSALPADAPAVRERFLDMLHYLRGDYRQDETYQALAAELREIDRKESATPLNHLFYLAISTTLYSEVIGRLAGAGLLQEPESGTPWRHVVLEKPFGHDLASAEALDHELHRSLAESQIYRIDHYLGKETVQNIAMLRFANLVFEPVWNRHYIDHVQITVAEELGVEHRAGYYEQSGLLRDMFQNHMLEMLALAAMEMPQSFLPDAVRDEKLKLIRSIRPFSSACPAADFVRAQYVAGHDLPGYRQEPGVAPDSNVETYVAARLFIDNWRWRDVPFYLRSGKRLGRKLSEIAIVFKHVPHSIFAPIRSADMEPDTLVLKVQPEEGMALTIQAKQPGPKLCMGGMTLHFNYAEFAGADNLDAYARLLLDALLGDQTLFIRSDVIAASWQLFSPVLDAWRDSPDCSPLHFYQAGTEGPEAAAGLLFRDHREWRPL